MKICSNDGIRIYKDDVVLNWNEVDDLAMNDGFDCLDDFWAWFDQYSPFTGKIIHWTSLIY